MEILIRLSAPMSGLLLGHWLTQWYYSGLDIAGMFGAAISGLCFAMEIINCIWPLEDEDSPTPLNSPGK